MPQSDYYRIMQTESSAAQVSLLDNLHGMVQEKNVDANGIITMNQEKINYSEHRDAENVNFFAAAAVVVEESEWNATEIHSLPGWVYEL